VAWLTRAGYQVHTIFFKHRMISKRMEACTEHEVRLLCELVKDIGPFCVGLSVRSSFFQYASKITGALKKVVDVPIIWGGIHPTVCPDECIAQADIVCRGEGDEAFVELADKLSAEESIDGILNLWVKKKDGQVLKNGIRPLLADLDSVPLPVLSNENKYFIENDHVLPMIPPDKQEFHLIMSSRGCVFGCSFCVNCTLRGIYRHKGKYLRRRSVENVMQELTHVKAYYKNLKSFLFVDDVFTFDEQWISRFSNEYQNKIGLPFFCYCQPATVSEKMIQALKDAGLYKTRIGIQGSERVRLESYHKAESDDQILKTARLLKKYKVNCAYDIIRSTLIDTPDDFRSLLSLLLRLPRPLELRIFTLNFFPMTRLTESLLKSGKIQTEDLENKKSNALLDWVRPFDPQRSPEDLFRENILMLSTIRCIPRRVVLFLSKCRVLIPLSPGLTRLLRMVKKYALGYKASSSYKLDRHNSIRLTAMDKQQEVEVRF